MHRPAEAVNFPLITSTEPGRPTGRAGLPHGVRRDTEPHRGALIAFLGNVSMIAGGLSLCTGGLGAVFSVPLGVVAWVMANHDLEQMRAGLMDPRGQAQTETGRTGGVLGVVLG